MEPSHDPAHHMTRHHSRRNTWRRKTNICTNMKPDVFNTCRAPVHSGRMTGQHYCQSLKLGGLPGPGWAAGPRVGCRAPGGLPGPGRAAGPRVWPHRRLITKSWTHWWSETPAEGGASVQPLIGGLSGWNQPGSQILRKTVLNTGVVMLRSGDTGTNWRFKAPSCPTAPECNTSTH